MMLTSMHEFNTQFADDDQVLHKLRYKIQETLFRFSYKIYITVYISYIGYFSTNMGEKLDRRQSKTLLKLTKADQQLFN